MLIKTIEDKENGKKWEIYKKSDNEYFYRYYEFFKSCGWKFIMREGSFEAGYISKDCIEWDFDIIIA